MCDSYSYFVQISYMSSKVIKCSNEKECIGRFRHFFVFNMVYCGPCIRVNGAAPSAAECAAAHAAAVISRVEEKV